MATSPKQKEDASGKKDTVETQTALAAVMKKLREANEKKHFEHADAQSLKKGLVVIMDKLRHDDKSVRKEALFALKQSRLQIQSLEAGALSNKDHIVEGLDAIIKSSEQGSTALIGMTKVVESRLMKIGQSMPTTKTFISSFLKNSNPLLNAAISVVGDIKGLYKLGKAEAKKDKDEEIKIQEDLISKTIESSSEVADALQASSKEVKQGLNKIDIAQSITTSELQKQTIGINSLNLIGHGQTRVLSALLKTWDSEASITSELMTSVDLLGEYVKGIKAGVASEGAANGLTKEAVEAVLSGIDQEASNLTKSVVNATAEEQAKFISAFNEHLLNASSLQDNKEGNQLLSKISSDIGEQLMLQKKDMVDQEHSELKGAKKLHVSGASKMTLPNLKDKEKEGNTGILGVLTGLFGVIGMFSSMAATLKTIQSIGAKVTGVMTAATKSATALFMGAEAGATAIASVAKPISAVGKTLMKLAKISGVLTIITAAIDFFDGFTDAANILDKNEKDLNFADKVAAGLGGVLGGFLSIFDMVGGWVGLTTGWSKDLTKSISKTLADCFDFVKYVASGRMMDDLFKTVTGFVQKIPDIVFGLLQTAGNYFDSVFGELLTKDYWKTKLTVVTDYIKDIPRKMFEMLELLVKDYLKSIVDILPSAMVPDRVKEYISTPTKQEHSKETQNAISQIPTASTKFNGVVSEVNTRSEFPTSFKAREREIERMMKEVDPPKSAATTVIGPTSNTVHAGTTINNNAPLSTRNDDDRSFVSTMSHMAWGA